MPLKAAFIMKGRIPAVVAVYVSKAQSSRHTNEECYVKLKLNGKRARTSYSNTLIFDGEGCDFTVRDPQKKLEIFLRGRGDKVNYGYAKIDVTKIEHEAEPESWYPYPIYSGKDRKHLGHINMKLWVKQWMDVSAPVTPDQPRLSYPRVHELSSSKQHSPRRSLSRELDPPHSERHAADIGMVAFAVGYDSDEQVREHVRRTSQPCDGDDYSVFSADSAPGTPTLMRRLEEARTPEYKAQAKPLTRDYSEPDVLAPIPALKLQEVTMQPGAVPAMTMHTGMSQVGAVTRTLSPGFTVPFFGCFDVGCTACLLSFLAPCYMTALSQADLANGRDPNCCDVMCANAYDTRQSIRVRYQLGMAPCADCCACVFCHCCVVSQNTRECAVRPRTLPVTIVPDGVKMA